MKDGADVLSNSWGSSHQNTLAWPTRWCRRPRRPSTPAWSASGRRGTAGLRRDGQPAVVLGQGHLRRRGLEVRDDRPVDGERDRPRAGSGGRAERRHRRRGLRPVDRGPPHRSRPLRSGHGRGEARGAGGAEEPRLLAEPTADDPAGRPFAAGSLTGKIALIERGVCNFSDKVYNAQYAGAIGAVIYNPPATRR